MQSLLNFRFGSAICAGGHTGCVQKEFLSEFHRRGAKPRKINIAAKACYVRVQESKNDKKIEMERFCNPLKRMELVITPRRGNTSSVPQCARVPEAGIWNKIITPICTSASPPHQPAGGLTIPRPPPLPAGSTIRTTQCIRIPSRHSSSPRDQHPAVSNGADPSTWTGVSMNRRAGVHPRSGLSN